MEILTKPEYDAAVERIADETFDPMGDDGLQDFSLRILELVDEGRQEEARDRLKERCARRTLFEHGLGKGPVDDLSPVIHGCIIEHSDRSRRLRDYWFDGMASSRQKATKNADLWLGEMAGAALFSDAFGEVCSRVRRAVGEQD